MSKAPHVSLQAESRASKRSSRSISSKPASGRSSFGEGFVKVTKTYSSPLMSIGNCRLARNDTDNEIISSFKDIKSECFQWGAGKKILEKPKLLRGKHIRTVACGGSHTLALLDNGTVYSWGDGKCGQLGLGSSVKETEQPRLINVSETITEIYAGFTQSAFITKSGKLLICGFIGREIIFEPETYPAFDNVKIKDIAFGPSSIGTYLYILYKRFRRVTNFYSDSRVSNSTGRFNKRTNPGSCSYLGLGTF